MKKMLNQRKEEDEIRKKVISKGTENDENENKDPLIEHHQEGYS